MLQNQWKTLVFWSPRGLVLRARRGLIWGIWGAAPRVILRSILRSLLDFFLARFGGDVEVNFVILVHN